MPKPRISTCTLGDPDRSRVRMLASDWSNCGTVDAELRSISCAVITLTPIGYRAVVSSKRVAVTVTGGPTVTAGSAACAGMMVAELIAASTAAASGAVDKVGLINSPMGCARPPRAKKRIGNAMGI